MKKSDGFTLVELLVGILCAAIVTGAAMTLMLMGARSNRALLDANSEQNTARIITTMVETLASEGSIKTVVTVGDHDWALLDGDGATILNYSGNTIYSHGDVVLMDNVSESSVSLSDERKTITGRLLEFSLTANEGTYKTSVFCRTADMGENVIDSNKLPNLPSDDTDDDISINMSASEETGRFALLKILCSQYGSNGQIHSPDTGSPTNQYFSEWFLKAKYNANSYKEYNDAHGLTGDKKWNEDTPWCACFLSWGTGQIRDKLAYTIETYPYFADVGNGYQSFLMDAFGSWHERLDTSPSPGDFIFFDWDNTSPDSWSETASDLDHVGAVFYTDDQYVYTIEGNSGVGVVDLKRYLLTDPRIIGYGILNWK